MIEFTKSFSYCCRFHLTFTTLSANLRDHRLGTLLFFFSHKTGPGISCKMSPILHKMSNPVLLKKNNKNISTCRLPNFFPSMLSVIVDPLQRSICCLVGKYHSDQFLFVTLLHPWKIQPNTQKQNQIHTTHFSINSSVYANDWYNLTKM